MLDIDAFSWITYLMCEYWFQVPLNPYYPPGVPFPHFPAAHMNHPMYKAADIPGHQPPPSDEYPERPGQPECQHFVKSGFCKYRMKCRYHHPRSRQSAPPPAGLSPIGLPIKPVSSYPIVLHSRLRSGESFQKIWFWPSLFYFCSAVLLQDQPVCTYYGRYGFCKYGPACMFNHPFNFGPPVPAAGPPLPGQYPTHGNFA